VQAEHAVDWAQFGRLDQPGMRDRHRMQRPLQLLLPEREKILQCGKSWKQVVVLPDVALQQPALIRTTIENFGRRQAVPLSSVSGQPIASSKV
jgi:hypothetical protein